VTVLDEMPCPVCGTYLSSYPFENYDMNDCCISFLEDYLELDEDTDYFSIEPEELDFNDDEDY
jgi:hypothetical protein